jgi:YaiO family outer membrane protein
MHAYAPLLTYLSSHLTNPIRKILGTFLFIFLTDLYAQTEAGIQTETSSFEELAVNRPSVFDGPGYLELGHTEDHLTNNYKNWSSQYLNLFVPMKEKGMFNIQLEDIQRYGIGDQQVSGTYAYSFRYGVLNFEASYSANATYLAKYSFGSTWNGRLPSAFGYTIAATQRQYMESLTHIYKLGLEKYVGDFRFAYTGILSTINQTQPAYGQVLQLQWVGSTNNKLGLAYSFGMEPTVLSPGSLASVKTQFIQIDGLYWLTKEIGITAALWHGMQGEYFERNGGQLGVRVAF